METQDTPKQFGLFYVTFQTIQLYIKLDQFIIVQVNLPTLSHQVYSHLIPVLKRLHLNLFNIVTLLNLKVVLVYHHTRLKCFDYIQLKIVKVNPQRDLNRSDLNTVMVAPPSIFYTVSTVLFHKYGGANDAVTNCMSHFSMFFPTNSTVKLDNGNTGHDQLSGIFLSLS